MNGHNDELRMSDEELQQFADNLLYDYKSETRKGGFVVSLTPLAVRELILRELERSGHDEGQEADPGVL